MSHDTTKADGTLGHRGALALARMIRDRKTSSVELARYFIGRIERLDGAINAVVARDFDRALAAARRADDALARGEATGPLHGLPITVKEAIDVAGLASTWGVPAHRDRIASTDAHVVGRLRAAGAVVLGKTNVPFMLADFQSYNDLHGTTRNPWDPTRVPGGSSGGSAAALAAGLTGLEIGSDIGGSIRNPACFCGVYGHKPTWGIVPQRGHGLPTLPAAPDMAVIGPLARSAEDLSAALDVIAGPDPLDAPGWRLDLPASRVTSLRGLRVAVWPSDPVAPVDAEIEGRVVRLAEALARRGATVSDRARPAFDAAASRRTYVALVNAVTGSGVPDATYEANRSHAASFDPGDTSKAAFVARSMVLDHRAWLAHDAERRRIRDAYRSFFEDWDILLCPVMATPAFPHDHRPFVERKVMVNGEPQPYFHQVFWNSLASVAYLPATVFPAGLARDGLPIGLQAIGAAYADRTTIAFARCVAEEEGGFAPPPGFAD